jgi:hypothetical protein
MRRFIKLVTVGAVVSAVGLAWAQKPAKPRQPVPVISSKETGQTRTPFIAFGGSVTPGSVTFTSSNPDGSVTGSSTATVSFNTFLSPTHFTVYAKAVSANFTGCNSPPASSVTVACSTPSGVTCAASAALTNTGNGTTVAAGSGNHFPTAASFAVTYTFHDAWSYQVGTSCSLSVQYLYTEP